MRMHRAAAALLAPIAFLGGCVSLLPEQPPAPRLFVLDAGPIANAQDAPLDVVIGIASPLGERAILGAELAWRSGGEIAFVAGTQWSGRAQDALQAMLVETLSRQGRVRAALRMGEARSDYDIRWDIIDFEIVEQGGALEARFVADVKLLRAGTREVVGARMIETQTELQDRSASLAADALTRAAREGGARIADFAIEAIEADQSSAVSTSR